MIDLTSFTREQLEAYVRDLYARADKLAAQVSGLEARNVKNAADLLAKRKALTETELKLVHTERLVTYLEKQLDNLKKQLDNLTRFRKTLEPL